MRNNIAVTPAQQQLYADWVDEFGDLVRGELSVLCTECGASVWGDGDPVPVMCWTCFSNPSSSTENEVSDDPLENGA